MSFGQFMEPGTCRYTDDWLIGKAFEALRCEFGKRHPDFNDFAGRQWKRAKLVMEIEGRATNIIVNALRPFCEAECDNRAKAERERREGEARWRDTNHHMARMIGKGML
jgi:hypothetical protein